MTDSKEIEENFWNFLPDPALVSIFGYLENQDRLNAGLVCKNWNFAFESPTLWQKMDFYFGIDIVHDSRKALQFMRRHASALKHLRLQFRRFHQSCHKEVALNLHAVLLYLRSCSQLHSLQLDNFQLLERGDLSRPALLRPFKKFVASQRRMRSAVFVNSRFALADGLEVLEEIAKKNGSLETLGLTYFFEETVTVFENTSFQTSMKSFNCLKNLALSYQCLSTEIMSLLITNKYPCLEQLTVVCDSIENLQHTVLDSQWKAMKKTYSELLIIFEMVEVVTLQQFSRLLPLSTEVSSLDYRCGFSIPTEESLRHHGQSILQYINHTFSHHLRCIKLDFGFVGISRLERGIVNLLRSCKSLREATIKGVLPTLVAAEVSEIALEEGSVFQDINLVFYFKTIETLQEMRQLEYYKQSLTEKGINFHFNLLS